MIKDKLLALLREDEEIQKAIKKIVKKDVSHDDECSKKDEEIVMLKEALERLKELFSKEEQKTEDLSSEVALKDRELQDLQSLKRTLKEEISQLEAQKREKEDALKEMRSSNSHLSEQVGFYDKNFKDALMVYELYKNLSTQTKTSIKGIFKDESLNGFLACGMQERNIDSLWEYIKNEIIEDNNPDIKSLVAIFDFFFERFSLAFPLYQKQPIETGKEFDTQQLINADSTTPNGTVKEVLLYGWINTKTDKIIKKSIVRI